MNLLSFETFFIPAIVFVLVILGVAHVHWVLIVAIAIGIFRICTDSIKEIRQGRYSLDYVAFVAMVVSLASGEYLAGAVVALMFSGGKAFESYASKKAYATLASLGDSIPKRSPVYRNGVFTEVAIQDIHDGDRILIKRNEIVPLDGTLLSSIDALFNFSNLTGEIEPTILKRGTFVKSGAINVGESVELVVKGDFSSSTYHKIVRLVEGAKAHPARLVRLSERANIYFTIATFLFTVLAYGMSGDVVRILAVLVIATPCPLIIAAPVAFIGGMSKVARSGIIMRKPSAFEGIARASLIFFDKTGTLTMGEPQLSSVEVFSKSENEMLSIAASLEINSLHPLARAIVHEAEKRRIPFSVAQSVSEHIGQGITGSVSGVVYEITAGKSSQYGITLVLMSEKIEIAQFHFSDILKAGVENLFADLEKQGTRLEIITGDKKENAEKVFKDFHVVVHAETSPEDKYHFVTEAHKKGNIVVMVGDGLNDAPALARADVGIVFSGTENGASIEAADVVMLDRDIARLGDLFSASRRTLRIAQQSIYGGIILSCIGMCFAAFGTIPPVTGALIQEIIDVVVIVNALRTLR